MKTLGQLQSMNFLCRVVGQIYVQPILDYSFAHFPWLPQGQPSRLQNHLGMIRLKVCASRTSIGLLTSHALVGVVALVGVDLE